MYPDKRTGYILTLNNDTVVTCNFLVELMRSIREHSQIRMAAPVILNYYNPNLVDRLGIVVNTLGVSL